MMKVSCILLAAGDSSRMGRNKLMLEVHGTTLIKKTLSEINKIPFHDVVVVTGFESERILKELTGLKFRSTHNPDFVTGMHTSIKAGVKALKPDTEAFFVCLSDQPYFHHENLLNVMEGFKGDFAVPVFDGKRGHPVLISQKYIPEILSEPDGDYGCAYLLKRHPHKVEAITLETSGILTDVDAPEDYEAILEKEYGQKDPVEDFYQQTLELRKQNQPFAVASVIEVIGSASARTGSKAIFNLEGRNLLGWVGGGCAERFIGEQSIEAIHEGKTRVVLADLDDEIFGLGVACGGKMKVFIDPVIPSPIVKLADAPKFQNEIRSLSGFYGWNVKKDSTKSSPATMEELLMHMTKVVAHDRDRAPLSLREVKKAPAIFTRTPALKTQDVTIVGRTRITEALARHFTLLNYNIRAIGPDVREADYPSTVQCHCLTDSYSSIEFRKNEIVIIASHTSQDAELVKRALDSGASYVGMIGSLKRSHEVLSHLHLIDQKVDLPLFIPAGLDMKSHSRSLQK